MTPHLLDLETSILAAERAIRSSGRVTTTFSEDPFRLDLPAVTPTGGGIDAQTMATLGGLYLIAMLEQTGMLRAVELLAEQRVSLDIRSVQAAELLDEAARAIPTWFKQEDRHQLFARVFGLGPAARSNASVNTDFESRLLELCSAVDEWQDASHFDRPPAVRHSSAMTYSARGLRSNLAPRQYGNTLSAARRIAAQVRVAHEVLNHEGVIALVLGRTMWDVVRSMWSQPPDIDRLVTLGQNGQQIVAWAGTADADRGDPSRGVVDSATLWLRAMHDSSGAAA